MTQQSLVKLSRPRLYDAVARGLVTGGAGRLREARLGTAEGQQGR
jgi:hypothetical protein